MNPQEKDTPTAYAIFFQDTPLQIPENLQARQAPEAQFSTAKLAKTEELPPKLRERLQAGESKGKRRRYFADRMIGEQIALEGPSIPEQAVSSLREKLNQRKDKMSDS